MIEIYTDNYPFLEIRKKVMHTSKLISYTCLKIIKNPVFEGFSLLVIIFNSIMLASDNPTSPPT